MRVCRIVSDENQNFEPRLKTVRRKINSHFSLTFDRLCGPDTAFGFRTAHDRRSSAEPADLRIRRVLEYSRTLVDRLTRVLVIGFRDRFTQLV